jgi:hypothetical protein
VFKDSNQPPHHLLQNVNYSRSACKCRQGLSKRKQNGAVEGYLGWRRGGVASGGGVVVVMEGLRWPARLLLLPPLPPLFFISFSFLFPLLCSLVSLVLRSPPFFISPFSVPFLSFPPFVFIGKTEGGKTPYYPCPRGTWPTRPLCGRPEPPKGYVPFLLPPRGKQVGRLCRCLFEV